MPTIWSSEIGLRLYSIMNMPQYFKKKNYVQKINSRNITLCI